MINRRRLFGDDTRYVVITSREWRTVVQFRRTASDGKIASDSKALHDALCLTDPGDEYSITFTNRMPRDTSRTDWY